MMGAVPRGSWKHHGWNALWMFHWENAHLLMWMHRTHVSSTKGTSVQNMRPYLVIQLLCRRCELVQRDKPFYCISPKRVHHFSVKLNVHDLHIGLKSCRTSVSLQLLSLFLHACIADSWPTSTRAKESETKIESITSPEASQSKMPKLLKSSISTHISTKQRLSLLLYQCKWKENSMTSSLGAALL